MLDEAYGDFCDKPHRAELLHSELGERIVITRTLSKSYSLAGIRLGFSIANGDLSRGMRKVKDSYNCDALSLAAGIAALDDQPWMQHNAETIRRTRDRLTLALRDLGFHVVDSQANFVWATHPDGGHRETFGQLKQRRILVRYMRFPGTAAEDRGQIDGLRITAGTDEQIDRLLDAMRKIA
ncbi:MAG: aminotransferase class I/II-fold pyridoxal phosphate-dependent enzyme [Planctomycetes bacterium]|nr:aminotransferase class I/II-fold pyridoxal phosphate-dependent enzyme [Planctomycetota bacterium]